MCAYIQSKHVMPGYVCCVCKSYNGLQRSCTLNGEYRTLCQFYGLVPHSQNAHGCALTIGNDVAVCSNCHAGSERNGGTLIGNLAGELAVKGQCFVCKQPFVEVTAENDSRLFNSLYGKAVAA